LVARPSIGSGLALIALVAQLSAGWLHAWEVEADATNERCAAVVHSASGVDGQLCSLAPREAHHVWYHDAAACSVCQLLQQTRHAATGNDAGLAPPSLIAAALIADKRTTAAQRFGTDSAPRAPPVLS
jgi:hypothetical protein